MPCYDGREREVDYVLVRLACDYCTVLEREGQPIPGYALAWWITHKRLDQERKQLGIPEHSQ